jgi:choline transport protein
MILSLAQLNNSDYVQQKWHLYVTYLAVYWTCVSLNIIFSAVLSLVNNVVMTFSLVSVIATFIAILICHYSGFRSTHFVWAEYTNNTGWDSNGLTFLLAIANAIFSLLGIDGAAHLTDEITLPAKYVPKAMVYSSIMGFFTAWPFIIALSYLIKDVDSVLNSSMAITEIYFQSLGSASGATFLMCLILFTLFGGLVAGREAASRITRAFAVDGGLPFSSFLSKIDRRFHIPVNAMLLEGLFVSLYGVIMLGSNVAFSSIINTLSLFLIISYTFPQVMLLIKGRNTLPKHYFDLGRFGYFVNYTSVLFTSLFIVILCYPSYKDVSATNMNWVAVSFVGLSLIIVLMWFAGLRNTYRGPILDVEKITLLREEPFAGIARD